MNRYFFHSFPRPRKGETETHLHSKGQLIAKNMLQNGLLLVPESVIMPIKDPSGKVLDEIITMQCRICFTELGIDELTKHSEVFGPFALAFKPEHFRRIGGLPVNYVPFPSSDYFSSLGAEIYLQSINTGNFLEGCMKSLEIMRPGKSLILTINGKEVQFSWAECETISRFFNLQLEAVNSTIRQMFGGLGSAAHCFYPTENPDRTDGLYYYRQREWRLIDVNAQYDGSPQFLNTKQLEELNEIDMNFFSKKVECRIESDSKTNTLGMEERGKLCKYINHINDLDLIAQASFLIIPDSFPLDSGIVNAFKKRGIDVVKSSEVESKL